MKQADLMQACFRIANTPTAHMMGFEGFVVAAKPQGGTSAGVSVRGTREAITQCLACAMLAAMEQEKTPDDAMRLVVLFQETLQRLMQGAAAGNKDLVAPKAPEGNTPPPPEEAGQ
jgi:hypothetical protein